MERLLPVKVQGVVVDPVNKGFAVILKDDVNNKWLPIYIGPFEAQAIAFELEGQKLPRPSTHDLIKNIFDTLNTKVLKVTVVALKDNTFFANITVEINGVIKEIDSRPSDAIAIALRTKSPIFISQKVMDQAGMDAMPHENEKTKKLRELQAQLDELIKQEKYEEAAKIRDQINKIKSKLT
jgi:bifunctional DNase/RNase